MKPITIILCVFALSSFTAYALTQDPTEDPTNVANNEEVQVLAERLIEAPPEQRQIALEELTDKIIKIDIEQASSRTNGGEPH